MTGIALRRLVRSARHRLAYWGLWLFVAGLRRLPLEWSLRLGAGLGRVIGPLAAADHRRMQAALALTRVDATPGACWADLGRRFAELVNARRILPRFDFEEGALASVRDALDSGAGLLVATCHLGNWELMAAALAARGVPVCALGAKLGGGPLYQWLAAERARHQIEVLTSGGGARGAVDRLQRGGAIAVFVDRPASATSRERGGRTVALLGQPATPPATLDRLVRLAPRAARLLVYTLRGPGGRHVIGAEPIEGDFLVGAYQRIEAKVGQFPAQWVWLNPPFSVR